MLLKVISVLFAVVVSGRVETRMAFHKTFDFDKHMQLPANFIYAGVTQTGKTTMFLKTLQNLETSYNPKPKAIYYLYSCYQESFVALQQQLKGQGVDIHFSQAAEFTETELKEIMDPCRGQIIIAIDDSTMKVLKSKSLAHLLMISCHYNASIVLLLHTLFGPGPEARVISLNTQYFFLFNSPRIRNQVVLDNCTRYPVYYR